MFDIEFASEWQHLAKLPEKRHGHAVVMVGESSVAVVGGYNTNTQTYLDTVDVWDTCARVWTSFKMKEARGGCSAVAIGNQLFVIGGYNREKKRLASMEMVDLTLPNNQSLALPPMPTARDESSAAIYLDRYIVVVGGRDRTSCLNVVEMYDTKEYKWTTLPSMHEKRRLFGMGCTGQLIMVAGGHNGINTLASAEMFDFKTKTWTPMPAMRSPRHTCGGVVVSIGKTFTFLVGGGSGHTSVESYSSFTKNWSRIAALTEISGPCKMTKLEDQVVAAGESSLVAVRYTPGGISNEDFIRRMMDLPKNRDVYSQLEQLGGSLGRLPQLQLFYSIVNVQYMLGSLNKLQRHELVLNALERCSTMCNSDHHTGFYTGAIMKARLDNIISDMESAQLKGRAVRSETEDNDFIEEQRSFLKANANRLLEYESVKEAVYNNILSIWKNLDTTRRSNQEALWTREVLQTKLLAEQDDIEDSKKKVVAINNKFKNARANRVESGVSFCSAVVSIMYMASQQDPSNVANILFGRIVDFSDIHHIKNVCKTLNNSRDVRESFGTGLKVAGSHDDMKLMEYVQQETAVVLIGAACGLISEIFVVRSDTVAEILSQDSLSEREGLETRQGREEIVVERAAGREGVELFLCGCF